MVDLITLALLAASFFFVVLAFLLLVRYREVSQRINVSTDLGRDLWASLEQRLKKQDARILDMMARVEVIQARAMAAAAAAPPVAAPAVTPEPSSPSGGAKMGLESPPTQQPASQISREPQASAAPRPASQLDETHLAAMRLLSEAPKNTRQLTDALGKSREHTARIMKGLFESGLVRRNDASKPFVYELTDEGRLRLSAPR
ncbi:MAG: winged helix-turn-helix transcriptional regulator [Nitrososphaerota archaeon]|nr:winged helix-turn-helix transcriptional regulator [Nitrososphaerota archaeon]